MEHTDLRTRCTSPRLAFADRVDCFVTGAPRTPKRAKMLAGINPTLDCPMILPQDIIEVRHRSVLAAGVQRSYTRELSDRGQASRMPISVDDTRSRMVLPSQGFGQRAPCRGCVLFGTRGESRRAHFALLIQCELPT